MLRHLKEYGEQRSIPLVHFKRGADKDEMAKRSVMLRDMKSGEQTLVLVDELGGEIAKRIG